MTTRLLDYFVGAVALGAFVLLLVENTAFGDAHPLVFDLANLGVLVLFAADVLYRLFSSGDVTQYLRRKWFDLIVFLPLLPYLLPVSSSSLDVVIRQAVIVVMLLSRSRKAVRFLALISLRPAQAMSIGFLGAIGIGTVLLMLPAATVSGDRTSLVDALFTATSAVCVTGLIVKDTATHFSLIGQGIILFLIQVGGLGIMTFSVSLAAFTAKQMDIKKRISLQESLDHDTLNGIRRLVRFIVLMTLILEAGGAILLFGAWYGRLGGIATTAYHAVFHSVSAFCNAGFSTFSDSLVGFKEDLATNAIVCALIISGGLGFLVVRDLLHGFKGFFRSSGRPARRRMRVQTRIVVTASLLLVVAGAALVYVAERKAGLAGLDRCPTALLCVFHSVTTRTAGFNTMDMGKLAPATLLLTMALMFIGGSPGSTAGGIKTTTFATLWFGIRTRLRNRDHTEAFERTLPRETVQKAVTILCLALFLVFGFSFALMALEKQAFVDLLFETISAFGTVGLSTGVTPRLTPGGKLLIAVLMYAGRLGPLTLAYVFIRTHAPAKYEYPEERVMIG